MKKRLIQACLLCVTMLNASFLLSAKEKTPVESRTDWHTQSNYQQVISTHLEFDLSVDFQLEALIGSVTHHIQAKGALPEQLILDTRDLTIEKAELLINNQWQPTAYLLGENDPIRGQALSVELKPGTSQVKIYYRSQPQASGLQWLTPPQTAGKKHPFMFSQSQAIHARSWMPVQDTPAMRVTYAAKIKTDPALRPLMSANNTPARNKDGIYQFEMPQAIPPYLIAIAAGDIHHKAMTQQTAIYAEKEYLDISAKEFEDTQSMIAAAEKLYGPYRWSQYDLLILPPSFPFGGMENPRLSFITPTVIAGDKSLVSLIAHELAHSWSGNLVTNATWRDLWLNEGFTSYVENRIMEEIFGKDRAVMEQSLSKQELLGEMKDLATEDTVLYLPIQGRDPDDAFTDIPYTKGQLFLMFLEQKFGRAKFDPFVRGHFDNHAFQSLDTATFYTYLMDNLINKYPGIVSEKEIQQWLYQPGLPDSTPNPESNAFEQVMSHIGSWQKGGALSDIPTQKWSVHEWLHFINNLPTDISIEQLALLDKTFALTQSTNNEIAHAWLLLSLKRGYNKVDSRLEQYLISIGRRRLIVPLYKTLIENPKYLEFARRVYQVARPGYHPLAQSTIDALFEQGKD